MRCKRKFSLDVINQSYLGMINWITILATAGCAIVKFN